jgi:hypothetical protein
MPNLSSRQTCSSFQSTAPVLRSMDWWSLATLQSIPRVPSLRAGAFASVAFGTRVTVVVPLLESVRKFKTGTVITGGCTLNGGCC